MIDFIDILFSHFTQTYLPEKIVEFFENPSSQNFYLKMWWAGQYAIKKLSESNLFTLAHLILVSDSLKISFESCNVFYPNGLVFKNESGQWMRLVDPWWPVSPLFCHYISHDLSTQLIF